MLYVYYLFYLFYVLLSYVSLDTRLLAKDGEISLEKLELSHIPSGKA